MGKKRSSSVQQRAPSASDGDGDGTPMRSVAVAPDRYGLLAKNAYKAVVSIPSPGVSSSAMLWMSESAMLDSSICVSQLVSVCIPAQYEGDNPPLELLCNANPQCISCDRPGAVFAVGVAWPLKALVKNGIRLSKQLSETLGSPPTGTVVLISSLSVKCRAPAVEKLLQLPSFSSGAYAAVIQECKQLSLQICEGSFLISTQDMSETNMDSFSPKTPPRLTPPLKTPSKSTTSLKTKELTSSTAKSFLSDGSLKMKEIVEKLAARWLNGRLLLQGNMVTVPICGNECVFHVKAAQNSSSDETLTGKLEELSLQSTQVLYYVSQGTSVIILLEEQKETSEKTTESLKVKPLKVVTRSYSSLGGLSEEVAVLKEIVEHSLLKPEILTRFGLKRTKGVLLYGPPGTGKSTLAQAVASEAGVQMFVINGPEVVSEYYGESEAALKSVFETASQYAPSVVFIDELDAITPERKDSSEELGQRIIATLLTLMDGVHKDGVLVIAATNRLQSIDPALRRHGRFDHEIEVGVPTPKGRLEILQVHLSRMKHELSSKDVQELASATHGFVGADLFALCNEAAFTALRRHVKTPESIRTAHPLQVCHEDFELARQKIRPSAMREVMLEVPKVRWSDVGGNAAVKERLREIVEWPHKHEDSFVRIGTTPPRGVLLYGPPGCSKTLMARAVAGETGLNFIAVKGPELFSKYVGESEKAVRAVFARAKAAAPSVIFFDEIDGLAVTRSSRAHGVSVEDRVMSQLLIELDGVTPRNGVSVIAATNRPDKLDPALLRPGRFDRLIYVGPPDKGAREQIFDIHLRNIPCGSDVSTSDLASRTDHYTGADIAAVCREATLVALEENLDAELVHALHFKVAISRVSPSKYDMQFDKFQMLGRT